MEAVLNAVSDRDWDYSFAATAKQASQLGPSHRARLAALKQLPAQCNRGYALQQAGAAYLLRSLCITPSKVTPSVLVLQHKLATSPNASLDSSGMWRVVLVQHSAHACFALLE